MRSFNNCRTSDETVVSRCSARRIRASCSLCFTHVETEEPASATRGRPRFPGGSSGGLFIQFSPRRHTTSPHDIARRDTTSHCSTSRHFTARHDTAVHITTLLDVTTRHATPRHRHRTSRLDVTPAHHTARHFAADHCTTRRHYNPGPDQNTPVHTSASHHAINATQHISPRRQVTTAQGHTTSLLGVTTQHLTTTQNNAALGVTSHRATSTARFRHPSARSFLATRAHSASVRTVAPAPFART